MSESSIGHVPEQQDETDPFVSEVTTCIRFGVHDFASLRNCAILTWSLRPGEDSIREQMSTPQGWAAAIACLRAFDGPRGKVLLEISTPGRQEP